MPGLLRSRAPPIARKAPPAPAMPRRAAARALLAFAATAAALALAARPAAACFETVDFATLDAGAPFSSHGHTHGRGRALRAEEGAAPWNYRLSGADWPGECLAGRAQSPIAFAAAAPELAPLPAAARAALDLPVVSGVRVFNNGCAVGRGRGRRLDWPIGWSSADSRTPTNHKIPPTTISPNN